MSPQLCPKVSIVSTTHNQAGYARQAFDSFLDQQTDFPVEIIVADDASTDATPAIIREYAERYPHVFRPIFRTENLGLNGNLTGALSAARGEYVALCEADDYWIDPLKLSKQVAFLDRHPKTTVCFHPVRVIWEDGHAKDSKFPPVRVRGNLSLDALILMNFIQTNSAVYRRLERYDDIPADVMPLDWYLHVRHAVHGDIAMLPDTMAVYRRHAQGMWHNQVVDPPKFWLTQGPGHAATFDAMLDLFPGDPAREELIAVMADWILRQIANVPGPEGRAALQETIARHPRIAMLALQHRGATPARRLKTQWQARRRDAEPQGARGCVALPAPTRLSSLTMSTNPGPAEGANQVMAQEHSAGAVQFTAHNVRLDDGTLTIPESSRTLDESSWFISARGILETVFPGDKSHLRLADVGCLEGGYAVGFARMGFQVLGIEVRELNMAACNYIKSKTNLPNLRFVHDNALNIANHGLFDTVFCCGLFYHLENPKQYLETLSSVTNKLLILQTHFSIINRSDKWLRLPTTARQLTDRLLRRPAPVKFMLSAPTEHEGLPGRWFTEFSDDRSFGQRDTAKWASWDNRRSFWIQREHLLQAIKDVGVDLVMEEYDNLEPSIAESLLVGSYAANLRGTFIGIKTR